MTQPVSEENSSSYWSSQEDIDESWGTIWEDLGPNGYSNKGIRIALTARSGIISEYSGVMSDEDQNIIREYFSIWERRFFAQHLEFKDRYLKFALQSKKIKQLLSKRTHGPRHPFLVELARQNPDQLREVVQPSDIIQLWKDKKLSADDLVEIGNVAPTVGGGLCQHSCHL